MTNEQSLAIIDAIADIGHTLTHTVGDYNAPNQGNIGNIMFSLDRIADKMEGMKSIDNRLAMIEEAVTAVAQTIDNK